jgi:S-adenosylmethionine decarboxylase
MNFNAIEDVSRSVGRHLLIDGFTEESDPLSDSSRIEGMFRRLVRALDMEILVPPVTKEVPLQPEKLASGSDEGGITSFCVITTSHVSIHTWPLRRFFSMDVYSCKDFDPETAVGVIRDALGVTSINVKNVVRRAPEPVEAAVAN